MRAMQPVGLERGFGQDTCPVQPGAAGEFAKRFNDFS